MKQFPIHVVTAWIGNSVPVAMKHYLQVTDADFELANKGDVKSDAQATQIPTSQAHATIRKQSPEMQKALAKQGLMRDSALGCEKLLSQKMAGTGFENLPETNWETHNLEFGGAQSGSVGTRPPDTDSDLQTVIEYWPSLSAAMKAGMLAMVAASED